MSRRTSKQAKTKPERDVISTRADVDLKRTFEREAPLRGHTASQAFEIALKFGLPLYLKRFPKQFEPVKKAA
jgi:hypothetical protein